MTDFTEEELASYRATCARRNAAEQRRQRARREAGRQAAQRAADLLRKQFSTERVVLFGSLARSEDLGPRSDIDLAVTGLSADDYYQAVARVQRMGEERSIDLVRVEDCAPSLRERIDEEGIPQPIREEESENRYRPPDERSSPSAERELRAVGRIGMTAAYRAVAGRIRQELDDVTEIAERAEAAWERYEASGDEHYLDSVALNLHDVYVGFERLFEDIARRVDQSVPDGPHWQWRPCTTPRTGSAGARATPSRSDSLPIETAQSSPGGTAVDPVTESATSVSSVVQARRELLDQMSSTIADTRPAVLTPDTRRQLERYQGFRHVVRNVYAAEFDPDQIEPLVRRLPAVCDAATTELAAFADALEHIADD